MHAMILDENRDFQWRELPDPQRGPDDVLIGVQAAAVNRADLLQRDGCYASPPGWPSWCGLEVAGVVLESPDDSSLRPGTRVCALVGGGGYAERIAVPQGMVVPIPDAMTMVQAASLPEVWCTAYLNLNWEAGGLRPGDVFYVQAAASGVGLAAIQLAKNAGAVVIASVGSHEKAAFVKGLGADYVVNYHEEDVLPILQANPPAVALDCVGGKRMGEAFRLMAPGGRWIMIASLAGGETSIDLETIWRKRLRLVGSTLRSRSNAEKSRIMQALRDELLPLFASGRLISHIHAVFPITEAEAAHQVLRRSENIGKVVLTV